MKKFLSALLVVLMLASISTLAFAAPSPTQDTGSGGGYWIGDAPKADPKAAAKADATRAEATAIKAIADVAADEGVVAALGKLPGDATASMKADFEKLIDALVDAKAALAKDEDAAIPADIKAAAEDSALVVAGQPFRAVASAYPATITIAVENPDDFVGLMMFVNGKWAEVDVTVNDDGTITFVLDQPAILSNVSQVVSAA